MDKCLVTKLKGAVSSDNPFYDAIRMYIKWGTSSTFSIKSSAIIFGGIGTTIKVIENGSIMAGSDNVGTEYTIASGSPSTIDIIPSNSSVDTPIVLKGLQSISAWGVGSNANRRLAYSDDQSFLAGTNRAGAVFSLLAGYREPADLSSLDNLPNKANITSIYLNTVSGGYKGDIQYLSGLSSLVEASTILSKNNPMVYGDIATFTNNSTIQNILLNNNDKIVGMIDNLSGCSALKQIDLQSTGVTGNLASLGACTNLTKIVLASTSVTGTVEDLVAAFNTAGKTSGTITIGFSRTAITYEGAAVSGTTLTWSGTNITIS